MNNLIQRNHSTRAEEKSWWKQGQDARGELARYLLLLVLFWMLPHLSVAQVDTTRRDPTRIESIRVDSIPRPIFPWMQTDSTEKPLPERMIDVLVPKDSLERALLRTDFDLITIGAELLPAPGGGSFFEGYHRLFGRTDNLRSVVAPVFSARIRMDDRLRVVGQVSLITTGFEEIYDALSFPPGLDQSDTLVPAAQIFERLSFLAVPVFAGVQFSPIRSQFTSFVGAEIGGAIVQSSWKTKTRLLEQSSFYRPTTNLNGPGFSPGFRLFTGVDLRFDRFYANGKLIRGVYLEAAYVYLPVARDFFSEIRANGRKLPAVPEEDNARVNLGGFSISFGITLQIERHQAR